jgi:hypothetical protein
VGRARPDLFDGVHKPTSEAHRNSVKSFGRKPEHPDGVVEDGCDGTPVDHGRGSAVLDGGDVAKKRWQQSTEIQIEWTQRALSRIMHAMHIWTAKAEESYVPGKLSEADKVLAGLWERRQMRVRALKYLRSFLLPGETLRKKKHA